MNQFFKQSFVLVFCLPAMVSAAHLTLQSDKTKYPVTKIGSETAQANLNIVLGDLSSASGTSLLLNLKNYTTVLENARKAQAETENPEPLSLTFDLDGSTVGGAWLRHKGTQYVIRPAIEKSGCRVIVEPSRETDFDLFVECKNLVPDSNALTLEMKAELSQSVALSEKVHFSPPKKKQ